jgi:hypothetical protein
MSGKAPLSPSSGCIPSFDRRTATASTRTLRELAKLVAVNKALLERDWNEQFG